MGRFAERRGASGAYGRDGKLLVPIAPKTPNEVVAASALDMLASTAQSLAELQERRKHNATCAVDWSDLATSINPKGFAESPEQIMRRRQYRWLAAATEDFSDSADNVIIWEGYDAYLKQTPAALARLSDLARERLYASPCGKRKRVE